MSFFLPTRHQVAALGLDRQNMKGVSSRQVSSAWEIRLRLRVEALTFVRFVAALIVVIFHFGREVTGITGAFASGPEMVTLFFVLSGFVMSVSYFNSGEITAREYWWGRFSRIMPVYLMAVLLMVAHSFAKHIELNTVSLTLNLLLLQAWLPAHAVSINGPGWSLSVEAFFYFSFPLLLTLIRNYRISAGILFVASLLCWLLTQFILWLVSMKLQGDKNLVGLIYYFPLSHFCSFLLGIAGGVWFIGSSLRIKRTYFSFFIIAATSILLVSTLNHEVEIAGILGYWPFFGSSVLAPLFLLFIISLAICETPITMMLSARPLVLLGEASFAIYILQVPLAHVFGLLFLPVEANFYGYLIFLIAISVMTHLLFEKPVHQYLKRSIPQPARMVRT